jgi:DNA topoisomerase-1
MILVIVESPSKCQTLLKILGEGYHVLASSGHFRDLAEGKSGVDIKNNFKPNYTVVDSKRYFIDRIHEYKENADDVIIATDADREGEAIGFHLCFELNLDPAKTRRIRFKEITKKAITEAMKHPSILDLDLFNAQQARRILDRLIGFELSPVIQNVFEIRHLSAGRCQSPALRLVCEKDAEINSFQSKNYFEAQLQANNMAFTYSEKLKDKDVVKDHLDIWKKPEFRVKSIEHEEKIHAPPPPFITSTLQKEASSSLNIGSKKCMEIAQSLYEGGHITYMRTDSIQLSDDGKALFKGYIVRKYGEEYYEDHKFRSKIKNAQEAHEAIRPTSVANLDQVLNGDERKLYNLIFKRTVQSLMASFKTLEWTILLDHSLDEHTWRFHIGQPFTIGFRAMDGWNQETLDKKKEEADTCTSIKTSDLKKYKIIATQKTTKPGQHYTEATLTGALEKLGIGRPSTWVNIVTLLQDPKRNYVERKDLPARTENGYKYEMTHTGKITESKNTIKIPAMKNQLIATERGMKVIQYLCGHFDNIMSYQFTGDMEMSLDDIANGEKIWQDVVKHYYNNVHDVVMNVKPPSGEVVAVFEGKDVHLRHGKHGYFLQCGDKKVSCSKETKDDDAIKLLKDVKALANYKEKDIFVKHGQHGSYLKWGDERVSCPDNVTVEQSIELIKNLDPLTMYNDINVYIKHGQHGPYLQWGEKKVSCSLKTTKKEAIELLKTLEPLTTYKGADVYLKRGPHGYYLQWGENKVSCPENTKAGDVKDILRVIEPITQYDGKDVFLKHGPHGYYLQCGDERVTCSSKPDKEELDCLLRVFKPLGLYRGEPIYMKCGKYGFYVQWRNLRETCLNNITLEEAVKVIEQKAQRN